MAERIRGFTEATGARGCRWRSYLALYQHVRAAGPALIWEGGTGASTVVLAEALAENTREGRPGRLISFEALSEYYEKFIAAFPEELRPFARLVRSDVDVLKVGPLSGYFYRESRPEPCDLFFVDGPTTPKGPDYFDADLHLFIKAGHVPAIAFVDGRRSTVEALAKLHHGLSISHIGKLSRIDFARIQQPRISH